MTQNYDPSIDGPKLTWAEIAIAFIAVASVFGCFVLLFLL